MKRCLLTLVLGLAALLTPSLVSAHYLWVTVAGDGNQTVTNIYFEGGPAAADGGYLDRFIKNGQTWIRTPDEAKPQLLTTSDIKDQNKRWISAKLPAGAPRSVESYFKFGVYAYGKTNVLLHYYGKHIEAADHEDLHELSRAEQLMLDIVPHETKSRMDLKVLFKGKPAVGSTVTIRGPKGFKANLKTDENGNVSFKPEAAGRYQMKASLTQKNTTGTDDGEDYTEVRHHSTLLMHLPLSGE